MIDNVTDVPEIGTATVGVFDGTFGVGAIGALGVLVEVETGTGCGCPAEGVFEGEVIEGATSEGDIEREVGTEVSEDGIEETVVDEGELELETDELAVSGEEETDG
jgi:hypothetical protein